MQTTYRFHYHTQCPMCNAPLSYSKVIGKRLNQSQGFWPRSKVGIATSVLKCKKCKLIYAQPMPLPLNLSDHYDIPAEKYWSQVPTINPSAIAPHVKHFIKLYGNTPQGCKVLDVGCGVGQTIKALETFGFDCYGIEPSSHFIDYGIKYLGVDPSKVICTSIEEASFPENSFDFIYMGAVLEHIADPSAALNKLVKWLKPKGLIFVDVPSSNYLIAHLINLYYKMIGTDYVTNISPFHVPFHLYEFSHISFLYNGKMNGYDVVEYEYLPGTFPKKSIELITAPLKKIMKITQTGMQLDLWIRKRLN
jgi:2-polyprenyl-3-methyl-5-hydroxy-6-metoxy-1,4-benzoquinol methylase